MALIVKHRDIKLSTLNNICAHLNDNLCAKYNLILLPQNIIRGSFRNAEEGLYTLETTLRTFKTHYMK